MMGPSRRQSFPSSWKPCWLQGGSAKTAVERQCRCKKRQSLRIQSAKRFALFSEISCWWNWKNSEWKWWNKWRRRFGNWWIAYRWSAKISPILQHSYEVHDVEKTEKLQRSRVIAFQRLRLRGYWGLWKIPSCFCPLLRSSLLHLLQPCPKIEAKWIHTGIRMESYELKDPHGSTGCSVGFAW